MSDLIPVTADEVDRSSIADDIDRQAQSIAAAACSGKISEHDARMQIMELVEHVRIEEAVVHAMRTIEAWERDEIAYRVRANMHERILNENDGGLDLTVVQTSSVVGWARTEGYRKANWSLGELRRERRRTDAVDEVPDVETTRSDVEAFAEDAVHDVFLDLAEGYQSRTKGKRARTRNVISARTLLDAYRLPDPVLPDDRGDRDWIADQVLADPSLPLRSVYAYLHLIDGTTTDADRDVDQRVLALWDDYSYEEIELLSMKAPGVAHCIVLSSVSRQPRPKQKLVEEIIEFASLASSGEGWLDYVTDVVETWMARECEPFSEYASPSIRDLEAARTESAARSERWSDLVADGARFGSPFTAGEDAVASWVSEIVGFVIAYPG